jgi:uncharacterized metal-binding protein YceD (DUF177 family)
VNETPLPSRTIDTAAIGDAGVVERIEATPSERAAIAAKFNLIAVDSLAAELDMHRNAAGLVVVDGHLRAAVVHTCVVSLEPAPQSIDERFRLVLAPAGSREVAPEPRPGAEIMVDPSVEQPEPVNGPGIDLGGIVLEHLSLALDPYPRAPGATLPAVAQPGPDETSQSPFAALAGLKLGKS